MFGGVNMAITGVYTNGVIKTTAKLKENQKVIIKPLKQKAFGGLHKYANNKLIPLEKEVLEDEFTKAYFSQNSDT